jgi:hypothetical protein
LEEGMDSNVLKMKEETGRQEVKIAEMKKQIF